MTIIQKLRAKRVIAIVAKRRGISANECRDAMVEAIAAAWTTSDPVIKDRQIHLIGEGRVPSPEEVISILSSM
jgi:hypothetical protein